MLNPFKAYTWYRVTLRVDDTNGFRLDVREREGSASASYTALTTAMPTGKAWSFAV